MVDRAEYVPYVVLGFLALCAILIYLNGRKYNPTKDYAIDLMQRVIEDKAHWAEWVDFLEIHVKSNAPVESIRRKCSAALEQDEYWLMAREKPYSVLSEAGKLKLKVILDEVKKGNV